MNNYIDGVWYDNVFLGAPDDEEEYEEQDDYDPDEIDYHDTDGEV
jgi:hypothetical protein